MKVKGLWVILLFLATTFVIAVVYFQKEAAIKDYIKSAEHQLRLLRASEKVWAVWRKGPYSDLYREAIKECPIEKFGTNLNCNQDLLNCVLKNSSIDSQTKGMGKIKKSKAKAVRRETDGELAPKEGVKIKLTLDKSELTILLEDNCEKIYLPKRIYGFGADSNPIAKYRFDNFNSHIFIDKNLNSAKGKSFDEIQRACSSRGMQLLESHILDAAAFHPVDLRNNRPVEFLRPKLPWTRNYRGEFPYKAQKDKNFKFDKKYCDFLYSKECLELKDTSLPSWMGLKNPLGGKIEVVRNISFKDQVLIPSSFYYSVNSLWHQLGLRAIWNGKGFDKRDFVFQKLAAPEIGNYKELELGYRCMQEVWR